MSYYKGSGFGGRGASGGGYRGGSSSYRGNRGNEGTGWRGGNRSYGSPGGRGGGTGGAKYYDSMPSSFDSRSKSYISPGSVDRYSGRARDDYRYSNQTVENIGYGGRFSRGSPEPPRKRMRTDSTSGSYGLASRRSHERSFSSNDYSGRGFYDKGAPGGSYLSEKGSYREVRETRPNDYTFRKPSHTARGSFRGRSVRGVVRRGFRSGTGSFLTRKKLVESYGIRKRISSRSREYYRRLKHYRLKRSGLKDDDDKKKESDDEHEDDEIEKEDDEDVEGEDEEADMEESGDEEEEDAEKPEGSEKEKESKDGEEEKKENEEVEVNKESESPSKNVKRKKKAVKKKKVENKDGKENEEVKVEATTKEGETSDKPLANFVGQSFINLKCPHCGYKGSTFKDYSKHLSTKKHTSSMQTLSSRLRAKLTAMRIEQREKQRSLDNESKSKNLRLTTFFCTICKLNYRTLKSAHQNSVSHKKMKAFVLPYCRICRMNFKSPWTYEIHLCDLIHIKRKARAEKLSRPPMGQEDEETLNDLDTSHFMVLDAVGSGDDASSGEKTDDENADGEGAEKTGEKKKKKKEEIKLGAEHCKLVEVYFCELCKIYLSRSEDREKTLTLHCRSRTHLQRYIRHRDDKSLRRRAVKLHKEHEKEKEQLKKKEDGGDSKTEMKPEENDEKKKDEDSEDKIWSEVDKDLSDLLQENEEQNEDEDDSRQEGERYDRFKQSDTLDKTAVDSPTKSGTANGVLSSNEKNEVEVGK
ncbi:glutamic acid-rich protein-like isoform X1 [Cimex lectularius]|uniref:C2H2-type domain-containing protein n=1 Tax=Cimex lectularius TaxID=79782 RepID=A0A8I6SHU5_CIMLE|nr:glutamic acid-rich protein-like isoform X1 [Cimex lectularius]